MESTKKPSALILALLLALVYGGLLWGSLTGKGYGFYQDDFLTFLTQAPDGQVDFRADAAGLSEIKEVAHAPSWFLSRGLRDLSFYVDRALFWPSAAGFHGVNVLVHGLALWLWGLVALTLGLSRSKIHLLWVLAAVHPASLEAVWMVSHRKELLAMACMGWGVLAFLRGQYKTLVLAFVLALGCHERAVLLPLLCLVIDPEKLGRIKAMGLKLLLVGGLAAFLFRGLAFHGETLGTSSILGRMSLALEAVPLYLERLLLPVRFIFHGDVPAHAGWGAGVGFVLLASTGYLFWVYRKQRNPAVRLALAGCLLFWGQLNWLGAGYPHADRYLYGALLLLPAALLALPRIGVLGLGVLLLFLNWHAQPVFQSERALFAFQHKHRPTHKQSLEELALEASRRQAPAAKVYTQRALNCGPSSAQVHFLYARLLLKEAVAVQAQLWEADLKGQFQAGQRAKETLQDLYAQGRTHLRETLRIHHEQNGRAFDAFSISVNHCLLSYLFLQPKLPPETVSLIAYLHARTQHQDPHVWYHEGLLHLYDRGTPLAKTQRYFEKALTFTNISEDLARDCRGFVALCQTLQTKPPAPWMELTAKGLVVLGAPRQDLQDAVYETRRHTTGYKLQGLDMANPKVRTKLRFLLSTYGGLSLRELPAGIRKGRPPHCSFVQLRPGKNNTVALYLYQEDQAFLVEDLLPFWPLPPSP